MPRVYTQSQFFGNQITKADDFLDEASTEATEFNGLLDQNNMPLQSVAAAEMAPATVTIDYVNASYPAHKVCHTVQQSQAYHVSVFCGADGNGVADTDTWPKAEWQLGWMRLSEKRFETDGSGVVWYPGAQVDFNAVDGMLVGEAMVDAEWRASYYIVDVAAPEEATYVRDKTFIEIGVFINDVCCGRTDLQWNGGRFTYVVPFSTPIGTGPVVADIRFRLIYDNIAVVGSPLLADIISDFIVTDSKLWIRNQYR